ncbi:RNA-binding cell elongation regulator Jag/EloR [Endomicrobium proavitum]|uniref:RNA-binding protein KhpB n=1 Tax=Endomicrobium proavitum TaxID=1408281 RepID=A0A0G3WKU3_9BACT|nr:RNA-binding cell elongation regulator Jag/EloR [Endomicrobium proavitum]AKL98490.1 SpoIIIJ-associated RNA/ssDNA-binding protein [Endomicrobium proavitum]
MPEIEIKAKSIEEAIAKGLKELNCTRENAEIKILDEGSSGLFGLMGAKPAVILISADKNCKTQPKNASLEARRKAEITIADILHNMGIELKKTQSDADKDIINLSIQVSDSGYVIGKNGQTLDALEYITQIIVNAGLQEKVKINLDCENYRVKQIEKLKALADKGVTYVLRTKKIYRFEPMNAKERKIIHSYLQDNPNVESFSEGEGIMRKVGIKTAK